MLAMKYGPEPNMPECSRAATATGRDEVSNLPDE